MAPAESVDGDAPRSSRLTDFLVFEGKPASPTTSNVVPNGEKSATSGGGGSPVAQRHTFVGSGKLALGRSAWV